MRKAIRKAIMMLTATSCALVGGLLVKDLDKPVQAAAETTPQITMVEGASIYVNPSDSTKSGIKFAYTTNVETLANGSSYGMMIVPYDYFAKIGVTDPTTATNVDFVAEFTKAQTAGTISYLPIMEDGLTPVEQTDGSLACSVGFIGIYPHNYDRRFVGVGYIKTVDGETASYKYATINDGNIRDITYVASAALSDPTQTWSDEAAKALKNYVETGIDNVEEYTSRTFSYIISGTATGVVGDKLALTTSVLDGVRLNTQWTSSDPAVAKVNADGEVRLLKVGSATITATTAGGLYRDTQEITVNAPERTLTITGKLGSTVYADAGSSFHLDYKNTPAVEVVQVEWTSSNDAVATVDSKGKVTQVGKGEVTITATIVGDTAATDSYTFTIVDEPTLKVSLNGTSTAVDYKLQCHSDANAGFLQSWLTATNEGNLLLDTHDAPMTKPIIRLTLPEALKPETHYEIKYTMTVNETDVNIFQFATGKHMFSSNDTGGNWYRIFTNEIAVANETEHTIHGTFTTGTEKQSSGATNTELNLVDLIYWHHDEDYDPNPYENWTVNVLFSDIEITEVTTNDVTVSITNADALSSMAYTEGKVFTLGRSIVYESSNNTLPGGRRVDFASSDPEVIAVKGSIHNGEFKIVGWGTTKLSVSLYGVEGAKAEVEVTVEEPVIGTVMFNGESVEVQPTLTAKNDVTWGNAVDLSTFVTASEGTLTIDGTNVVNPTVVVDGVTKYPNYRLITLSIAIPSVTLDENRTYNISYKVTTTAMTLGGGMTFTDFFVGNNGAKQDIVGASSKEMSGTAKIENGKLCIFYESNQMLLKDLQLTISDIEITEVVPGTVMFNGESVEVQPTLTAKNDVTWGNAVDLSTFITASEGTLTIDGTNVVNPDSVVVEGVTKNPNYRLITVYIAIPGVTFDENRTYNISYKVTTTEMTLGGSATATDFFVGNNGSKQDIVGASSKEMSGIAKIENGKLCIFYESNMMLLKGLKLTISDIKITIQGAVKVGDTVVEITPTLTAKHDYYWSLADVSDYVSAVDTTITIDGTKAPSLDSVTKDDGTVVNPQYRFLQLAIALPDGTLDTSKTYNISYKITATATPFKNNATATVFYVGGKDDAKLENTDDINIVGAVAKEVSGRAVIENGKLIVFFEGNALLLQGVQITISDIVITEVG